MNIAMLTLAAITCADAGLSLGGMTAIEVAAAAPVAVTVEAAPAAVNKPVILAAATPAESGATVAAPESIPEDLVFANESDETVADRVLAYLDGIDTLQGDFTQVAPSGAISTTGAAEATSMAVIPPRESPASAQVMAARVSIAMFINVGSFEGGFPPLTHGPKLGAGFDQSAVRLRREWGGSSLRGERPQHRSAPAPRPSA